MNSSDAAPSDCPFSSGQHSDGPQIDLAEFFNILHDTSGIFVNYNFSQIEKDTGSYKGLNDNGTKRG